MRIILVSVSFFIISITSFSQDLITDDAILLNRGIYKNFTEFKTNSPSIPFEYEIQSAFIAYSNLLLVAAYTNMDTVYTLKIEKETTNKIGTIWGFCDGKYAYINREFNPFSGKVVFKPDSRFYKILYLGRYCYFISAFPQTPNNFTHLNCAIDINSGELIEINKKRLQKLISKDEELLDKYKNEDFLKIRDELTYLKYIEMYSQKHKNEIKRY